MTEKYYLVVEVSGDLAKMWDNMSEESIMDVNEAVDKLNELTHENQTLKEENKQLKQQMTENKRFTLKNWDDYAEGDCIYYDNGEEMGSLDVLDTLNSLSEENEELKRVLGSILLEVKREINSTCQSCEVHAFVNPKSYDLISDVLGKYR